MRIRAIHSAVLAGVMSVGVFAQEQTPPAAAADPRATDAKPLEQLKKREQSEARRHGDRKVEVREQALWALSDLPPRLMHKAMEKLATEPEDARKAVMQSADIIELLSSIGSSRAQSGEQGGRAGANAATDQPAKANEGRGQHAHADQAAWSAASADELRQAAEALRELAYKIEYKQILNKNELRQPFARASVVMASFSQRAAQAGFTARNQEQTGYALKAAAEYFTAAHAFAERSTDVTISRAILDADRLACQVIALSKPTTYQVDAQAVQARDDGNAQRGRTDPGDAAQIAAAKITPTPLDPSAEKIIQALGQAIGQAQPTFERMDLPRPGVRERL